MADEEQAPDKELGKPTTEAEALLDVNVEIAVVLGTSMMPIAHVLKLGRGAVIELDRSVNEDIEVHANNRAVAKGEIIVIDDRLGVTLTEIIKTSI
jgi:flagellar motor switch protein FliN/FliY